MVIFSKLSYLAHNTGAEPNHSELSQTSERISNMNIHYESEEEVEEKVVAKTLNELDADILQAMQNLSITDDDIKSSRSGDQSNQISEENKSKLQN